eukprot:scaffold23536_cov15-Tisochrysis_lutea.AAC.1
MSALTLEALLTWTWDVFETHGRSLRWIPTSMYWRRSKSPYQVTYFGLPVGFCIPAGAVQPEQQQQQQ